MLLRHETSEEVKKSEMTICRADHVPMLLNLHPSGHPSSPWSSATMSSSDGLQLDPWPRHLQFLILVSASVTPWQCFTF